MDSVYYQKYLKYKNKFLNLRKQIQEFNYINEDRKIEDFIDPINKNKYLALQSKAIYLNLFDSEGFVNKSHTSNKNKYLELKKNHTKYMSKKEEEVAVNNCNKSMDYYRNIISLKRDILALDKKKDKKQIVDLNKQIVEIRSKISSLYNPNVDCNDYGKYNSLVTNASN
jgi:hypothetical protein